MVCDREDCDGAPDCQHETEDCQHGEAGQAPGRYNEGREGEAVTGLILSSEM